MTTARDKAIQLLEVDKLVAQANACTLCRADLPYPPRPLFQVDARARILIAGQAPGVKAHQQRTLFDDPSGERLRTWMGLDRTVFYNPAYIAILPMGFCYPGKSPSGDRPPSPICAPTWRRQFLRLLPKLQLTLAIGQYAQQWHLPDRRANLTQTVAAWRSYGACLPLPHPSPRNNIWLRKNRWFEAELLPELKQRVAKALA